MSGAPRHSLRGDRTRPCRWQSKKHNEPCRSIEEWFARGGFAFVGLEVADNVGFSLGWSGRSLNVIPLQGVPLAIGASATNSTNHLGRGRAAVLSATCGGSFVLNNPPPRVRAMEAVRGCELADRTPAIAMSAAHPGGRTGRGDCPMLRRHRSDDMAMLGLLQRCRIKSGSGTVDSIAYSHSIVPGGLLVISNTTRLTPLTSLTMRFEICSSTS